MDKKITKENIDAILKYLPVFEKKGFKAGKWEKDIMNPFFRYSKKVSDFRTDCYDQNIIYPFDWTKWVKAKDYIRNAKLLNKASLLTLRKLLTLHMRKDRFCEGHLVSLIEEGHIVDILRRLKKIREKMEE